MRSEELVGSLVTDLRPVRRLRGVASRTLRWGALALSCVGLGVVALGARPDLAGKLGDPTYLCENAALLLLFVLSTRSAFQLSVPGVERGQVTRLLPIVGLLLWLALIALRWSAEPAAATTPGGWSCVWRMTRLAILPSVALFFMLRRAAPQRREWSGSIALLSAGSLAMIGTQMICRKDEPSHVLLWHFGAVAIVGLIGVGVGRLLLGRRVLAPS
jgi:hypothetical protein